MKSKYRWVGFFAPALAVISLFTESVDAQCPESEPPRRATSGPYHYLRDRLVTDSLTPSDTQNKARESSISGDTSLSIGYETIHPTANAVYLQRFNTNGTRRCLGQFGNWDEPYIRLDDSSTPGQHRHVSVAQRHLTSFSTSHHCSRNPVVFACWQATATQGTLPDLMQFTQPFLIQIAGDFRQTIFNSNPGRVAIPNQNRNDVAPSAAVSCHTTDSGYFWESALSNSLRLTGIEERGLIRDLRTHSDVVRIRCCDDNDCDPVDGCTGQFSRHQPCVVHKDDSTQVIVWAEKEEPGGASAFNIALRVYYPSGILAAQWDRDSMLMERQSVNEPSRDRIDADQISPAVDMDGCGNIVVVWVGPVMHAKGNPSEPCTEADNLAVYARRFHYESTTGNIEPKSGQFRVDTSGPDWKLGDIPEAVHPTVTMRHVVKEGDPGSEDQVQGAFCVGWNAIRRDGTESSVRGQFFHADGRSAGTEFDLSPPADNGVSRTIGESNQHTMTWMGSQVGDHGDVFVTWTEVDGSNSNIWLTKVEREFIDEWEDTGTCKKGDLNLDTVADAGDVDEFITAILDSQVCSSYGGLLYCAADTNGDGELNGLDVHCFAGVVTGSTNPCRPEYAAVICGNPGFEPIALVDCNENGVEDIEDIVRGSADCNSDGVPDECQLADNDCDANDVPDNCQFAAEDCNHNGIVDSCDIAAETSDDCDSNGVPDECQPDCNNNDVADVCDITAGADDCNENGVPDDCEEDCNNNDAADECDITNSTSEDCNENGVPDECDISRAMLPSFDCNSDGIPDECQLSGNDENENGIPDDCEEESLMGGAGGESMMSGGGGGEGSEFDEAAAWELFFEWYDEQVTSEENGWGTLSGSERFHRVMDELQLLGLPYAAPW